MIPLLIGQLLYVPFLPVPYEGNARLLVNQYNERSQLTLQLSRSSTSVFKPSRMIAQPGFYPLMSDAMMASQ